MRERGEKFTRERERDGVPAQVEAVVELVQCIDGELVEGLDLLEEHVVVYQREDQILQSLAKLRRLVSGLRTGVSWER